jgi:hypothetical protein
MDKNKFNPIPIYYFTSFTDDNFTFDLNEIFKIWNEIPDDLFVEDIPGRAPNVDNFFKQEAK